jgi:hypothetical protein
MSKSIVDNIPEFLKKYPDKNENYTRDNNILASSVDILFTSIVLKNWPNSIKFIDVFRCDSKHYFYFKEGDIFYNPIDMSITKPIGTYSHVIKHSTFKKYFSNNYFKIRKLLESDVINIDKTIIYNDKVLIEDKSKHTDNIAELNSKLSTSLFTNVPINCKDIKLSILEDNYDVICPIDGNIKLSKMVYTSPEWTWRALCGREYTLAVCPKCLGVFYSYLSSMN